MDVVRWSFKRFVQGWSFRQVKNSSGVRQNWANLCRICRRRVLLSTTFGFVTVVIILFGYEKSVVNPWQAEIVIVMCFERRISTVWNFSGNCMEQTRKLIKVKNTGPKVPKSSRWMRQVPSKLHYEVHLRWWQRIPVGFWHLDVRGRGTVWAVPALYLWAAELRRRRPELERDDSSFSWHKLHYITRWHLN